MQVRELFKKVPLHLVGRNPLNPRTVFEGQAFDELVESIRKKGVLQPVLMRPIAEGSRMEADSQSPTHGLEVEYELVLGSGGSGPCAGWPVRTEASRSIGFRPW